MKFSFLHPGFFLSLAAHALLVSVLIYFIHSEKVATVEAPIEISELVRNLRPQTEARAPKTTKSEKPASVRAESHPENVSQTSSSLPPATVASAEGSGTAESMVEEYEVTSLPVPLTEVRVPFPSAARARQAQGAVVFLITISSLGTVVKAEPVSSPDEELTRVAQAALLKFKFKPAIFRDKPVAIQIRYTYRFVLQ